MKKISRGYTNKVTAASKRARDFDYERIQSVRKLNDSCSKLKKPLMFRSLTE